MKQLDDYTKNLKRPGWLWRYAMVLVTTFLLVDQSAVAQDASTDLTSCYGNCNSNDFTVTEVYLSSNLQGARLTSEACTEPDAKVNAYLSFTFRNNTNSDRSGIFLSATVNGISYAICFPGVLPKKRSTTFTYNVAIEWQCGTDLILENTFVGWGSAGEQVCSISCSQATPSKCRYLGNQIVNTPLFPDFEFTASCVNGGQFETISFDAEKTSGGFNNYTYLWNFGEPSSNSNTSTLEKPTHTYAAAGTYTVRLTVTDTQYELDASGNPTTTVISRQTKYKEQQVTVAACCTTPVITNETDAICSGTSFSVTPISGNGNTVPSNTTYTWGTPVSSPVGAITGGSAQTTGVNSISQTLSNNTTSSATLTYTVTPKSGGCTGNTFTVTVTVTPNAAITSVSGTSPLCIGGTATYTASGVVLGGGTGAWSSSNTAVATVNASGLVTAVGAGTADITYTITGGCGGTKSAKQSVTVTPNAAITSVSGTSPLCIGGTATYTASGVVLGGGTGAWSSSNTAVATVNASGLVTAVGAGTADITYTITGGCGGTKSAKQSVTVNSFPETPALSVLLQDGCNTTAKIVKSDGIPYSQGDYEFNFNGEEDANGELIWTNDPEVDYTVGEGYSIKVRRVGENCESSISCTVVLDEGFRIQSSNSLQSIEQPKPADDQLTAYPIPFSERTTLEFKAERDGNYEINLYDMKGTLIRQLKSGTAKAGEVTQIEVDGRSMADGMYLARMVSGSGAKTVKLLKKNR